LYNQLNKLSKVPPQKTNTNSTAITSPSSLSLSSSNTHKPSLTTVKSPANKEKISTIISNNTKNNNQNNTESNSKMIMDSFVERLAKKYSSDNMNSLNNENNTNLTKLKVFKNLVNKYDKNCKNELSTIVKFFSYIIYL
jgi:hypothetical protein